MSQCARCQILQEKVDRMSGHLNAMASDCAQLQKTLLDIGVKVRNTLGVQIVPRTSWQCVCDKWNYPGRDCCTNCGRAGD